MRLSTPGAPHLTYCTNIHPGETWPEVRANVERHVLAVKERVAPQSPFGVGLRLSAAAAADLSRHEERTAFRAFLDQHQLYVFTINGFPYGAFHGTTVKENVYLPDWLDDARLDYTDRLALLLADLLPEDGRLEGTVSTVPGAFKTRVRSAADEEAMATRLVSHAALLHALRDRTGKTLLLALEPEPCCHLETIEETIAFFEERVFTRGVPGLSRAASEACLRRHLGVCLDACHMAVEYEEPWVALGSLRASGIRVGKIQVSAGLEVSLTGSDPEETAALRRFADSVYLHQVVERQRDDTLIRHLDLPQALASVERQPGPREWRIHFHVPLFLEHLGRFRSTQPYLRELLDLVKIDPPCQHLEVETYTWEVLPEEHRRDDVADAVARELRWVVDWMTR